MCIRDSDRKYRQNDDNTSRNSGRGAASSSGVYKPNPTRPQRSNTTRSRRSPHGKTRHKAERNRPATPPPPHADKDLTSLSATERVKRHVDNLPWSQRFSGKIDAKAGNRECCRKFMLKECTLGEKCPYWHPDTGGRDVCLNFQRNGGCANGRKCAFAHVRLGIEGARSLATYTSLRLRNARSGSRGPE